MTDRHNEMFKNALLVSAAHDINEVVRSVLPLCCSLANADGGSIVVGDFQSLPESVEEVQSALSSVFSDRNMISADAVSEISVVTRCGEDFLVIDVAPAEWQQRPVFLNSNPSRAAYRSYEGELFASGKNFLLLTAKDSIDFQRDGEKPAMHAEIDTEALADYRARLRERRPFPKWDMLGDDCFLNRVGALDAGEMTLAGAMMFGKTGKAPFSFRSENAKPIKANNIWSFIKKTLPKIAAAANGSPEAERALTEAFFNAVIHTDYCAGGVEISAENGSVVFKNAGIPRAKEKNSALCRNPRIKKMLRIVGLTGTGMEGIKAFCADAKLILNLEKWETELTISVAEPTAEAEIQDEPINFDFYPVVSISVKESHTELEMHSEIEIPVQEPEEPEPTAEEIFADDHPITEPVNEPVDEPELPHFVIPVPEEETAEMAEVIEEPAEPEALEIPEEPEEEPEVHEEEPEILEEPEEPQEPLPEPNYHNFELKPLRVVMGTLVEDDEEEEAVAAAEPAAPEADEIEEFEPIEPTFVEPEPTAKQDRFDPEKLPVIAQMVRRNPRAPAVVVREALLDFCRGNFRSLPEISRAMLRSEPSLKRRYIKPLLTEKALEVNEKNEYRSVVE